MAIVFFHNCFECNHMANVCIADEDTNPEHGANYIYECPHCNKSNKLVWGIKGAGLEPDGCPENSVPGIRTTA